MKDYTSYMLAEILKGTFKAYGSAYGHGVSGVNMGENWYWYVWTRNIRKV